MSSNIRKGRRSIFREEGLEISEHGVEPPRRTSTGVGEKESREDTGLRSESTRPSEQRSPEAQDESKGITRWLSKKLGAGKRPRIIKSATSGPPSAAIPSRVSTIALLIAVVLPYFSYNSGRQTAKISGADAAVITSENVLAARQNSPTDVCTRWAGQSAVLNGTMYIYGGRSKTEGNQTSNTWNNDFLTLRLTESWDVNSPALTGLPRPDGPPAVSLGYLWNDYNHLFLYGGQFSDDPPRTPEPVSTWMYDIGSSTWTKFEDPRTSAGNYSAPEGERVQRSSEGAGVSVPELGLSWYFGGHLDMYTTPGWSNQVARVYLRSLLEFTHPGYSNSGVDDLHNSGAPEGGAYRNITQGGIQNERGFTERADGVLVYVPGWGPSGILLGLGGGSVGDHETTDAFASMTTIDVYDIKTSEWYHQETRGEAPRVRVNPCAVVFSAPDASSFNIYMYGGQNLLPIGEQTQYTDVWILTVPSFTWIKVDIDSSSYEPPARAGHHCAPRDGQLVVVGGYVGEDVACDSPGVYVFDASGLQWRDRFEAVDHPADAHADNSVLAGSYGYRVPEPVQSVVGGGAEGGATATTPAAGPAASGPFATGQAPVFTVTAPASTATVTTEPDGAPTGGGGTDAGKIVAGVIAGLAGLAALYLGFCAWLYRRQVHAYKRHMAVANRYSNEAGDGEECLIAGAGAGGVREKLRKHAPGRPVAGSHGRGLSEGGSSGDGAAAEQFGWVGQQQQQPPPAPGLVTRARASEDAAATASIWEGTNTGSSGPSSAGAAAPGGRQRQASLQPRPSEDRSPWGAGYDGYSSGGGIGRSKSDASASSGGSVEGLLDGREPNFFSVVLGPRRALRVVNGMENEV